MTDVADVLQQRPEPKRDRWGRYLIKGKPYTRATTWAGTVDERYSLEKWQQRQVAMGLAARPDLLARVAACRPDDKDELTKLCDQAIEASKGSAGANLGTALHAFTERVDLGEELTIPAPWDADVAAYQAMLRQAQIQIEREYVERIVVNHDLGVAGTFDRLAWVPDLPGNAVDLAVCDVKTGGFLSWQSIAVQLALYANAAELYDPATDSCSPMPFVNKSWGIVIHLPAGQARCELHLIDLTAGWEMAQTCGVVRDWRKRKDLSRPYTVADAKPAATPDPGDPVIRDWLYRRIAALRDAGHLDALAAVWPEGVPTFRNCDTHTAADLRRIETAVAKVDLAQHMPALTMQPRPGPPAGAEDMIARLKALDPAVLAVVTTEAGKAGLPPVRRMSDEQLSTLAEIVARVETSAA